MALDALAEQSGALADVRFVLSDAGFVGYAKTFEALLGPPDDAEACAWHLAEADARLEALPFAAVPELAPREARPNRGYAGDFWQPADNGW